MRSGLPVMQTEDGVKDDKVTNYVHSLKVLHSLQGLDISGFPDGKTGIGGILCVYNKWSKTNQFGRRSHGFPLLPLNDRPWSNITCVD